ncbi:MAG TPA: hypothetical protein VF795_03305 [Desulfuromonadaceae bacterium]
MRDAYDKILCLFLVLTAAAVTVMLFGPGSAADTAKAAPGPDKSMEREIAYQARVSFLQKVYSPVEALRKGGDTQGALFKLDELNRLYPNEAYGRILQGEILFAMGALDEAVARYAEGVKLNGDYVDRKSPLSRRGEIQAAAEEGQRVIGARSRANPDNRSLAQSLKNVNYLVSRLAGGCE